MELSNAVGNYLRAASAEERAQDAELAAFDRELGDVLVELMAPFTPHWSEELWHTPLGHDTSVHEQPWPEFDLATEGKNVVKVIVIPDRLVNIVVK